MATNKEQDAVAGDELELVAEESPLLGSKKRKDSLASNKLPDGSEGYSLWVGICFIINYSVGAGILGLPSEFWSGGWALGSICIVLLGLLSYITNMQTVEGILRAEAVTTMARSLNIEQSKILSDPQYVREQLIAHPEVASLNNIRDGYVIERNDYALGELIGIFGGKWWRLCYDISFILSMIIVLWDYNVLLGVVLARTFPIPGINGTCNEEDDSSTSCYELYAFWVCIFFVWTVCITLVDFQHQKWLQVTSTIMRLVIIAIMAITAIGLMYSGWYYDGSDYEWDTSYTNSHLSAFKWDGAAYFLAVAAFAYGNQFCIPDVLHGLNYESRQRHQHTLQSVPIMTCGVLYALCGLTIAFYFGANTLSPCTLGWKGYMGLDYATSQSAGAAFVSYIVLLLPAVDIGSAFPLLATSLSNTFEACMYFYSGGRIEQNPRNSIILKVCICVLGSGLALGITDFELVLALSGAFKLLATYIGPVILEWKSKQFMNDICSDLPEGEDASATVVTKGWISHKGWWWAITIISIFAFFAVFVYTIEEYS